MGHTFSQLTFLVSHIFRNGEIIVFLTKSWVFIKLHVECVRGDGWGLDSPCRTAFSWPQSRSGKI